MTKSEALRLARQIEVLQSLGFTQDEADKLRRISMTLRRWHERECGTDGGCIVRENEDGTGRPMWQRAGDSSKLDGWAIPDRETGAKKRLAAIIGQRNGRPCMVRGEFKPCDGKTLEAYIQTDPRGAALYILRPGDVPQGQSVDAYYTRGICVY